MSEIIKLVNGVDTIRNDTSYIIHVTEKKETGVLGVTQTKEEAEKIVISMGRDILRDLRSRTDPKWVNIKTEKNDLNYLIKIQKLGWIKNGSFKIYATVEAELVSNIYPSSLKEQIRDHPLSFKE